MFETRGYLPTSIHKNFVYSHFGYFAFAFIRLNIVTARWKFKIHVNCEVTYTCINAEKDSYGMQYFAVRHRKKILPNSLSSFAILFCFLWPYNVNKLLETKASLSIKTLDSSDSNTPKVIIFTCIIDIFTNLMIIYFITELYYFLKS